MGVIKVSFTLKQQQHVKLVKFAIEGESDRNTQKRFLLDKLSMIASELKINGAIEAALGEEITVHEEINPEKVDNYLKD